MEKTAYLDGDWETRAKAATLESSFAIQGWLDTVLKDEIRVTGGVLCAESIEHLSVVPVSGMSQYIVTVIVSYRFWADFPSEELKDEEAIPVKIEFGTQVRA